MEFLSNDLSIHNQFDCSEDFEVAIDNLMLIKKRIDKSGNHLQCSRDFINNEAIRGDTLLKVFQSLQREKRQALLRWLTQVGPFWDNNKSHSDDDYLDVNEEIVTGFAIAEAAYQNIRGNDYRLISIQPSNWNKSEIEVSLRNDDGDQSCKVINYLDHKSISVDLSRCDKVESWSKLQEMCMSKCPSLHFSDSCFDPLKGQPFVKGASDRIIELCQTLESIKNSYDSDGKRTSEGQRIYQDHFTGEKSWFSDSSDSEKKDFKSDLTFKHPENGGEKIFCPMHGKVKTPQYRVHFSSPINDKDPLYIVYIGPKITKR